jgi:hypothetical protein
MSLSQRCFVDVEEYKLRIREIGIYQWSVQVTRVANCSLALSSHLVLCFVNCLWSTVKTAVCSVDVSFSIFKLCIKFPIIIFEVKTSGGLQCHVLSVDIKNWDKHQICIKSKLKNIHCVNLAFYK